MLGKVLGGTVLAVVQAVAVLCCWAALAAGRTGAAHEPVASAVDAVACLGFLVLQAFALTALGYVMAWRLDSTQGYHALMSVLLMPMWLLSGGVFPGARLGLAGLGDANQSAHLRGGGPAADFVCSRRTDGGCRFGFGAGRLAEHCHVSDRRGECRVRRCGVCGGGLAHRPPLSAPTPRVKLLRSSCRSS